MEITSKMSLRKIGKLPEFKGLGKYLIYAPGPIGVLMRSASLEQLGKAGWNTDSMVYGLNALRDVAGKGNCLYPVYSEEECRNDKKKKDVNVIFMPKTADKGEKPFILICAGGGYSSVCSAVEGYPVAARFNEMGYDTFLLTYRVASPKILPKPIKDLAAALKMILYRREEFGVSENYVLCGFSAGANLISNFGTDNHGYKTYGLPKPVAMFPVYTFVNNDQTGNSPVMKDCLKTMYGKDYTEKTLHAYNIDEHMSQDFPPCYLVCGKNDSTVPPINSEILKDCLDKLGIPVTLEEGDNAEHGFGEGRATDVEGWPARAIAFLEQL